MSAITLVIGAFIILAIFWLISSYNTFVNLRTLVDEAWSDVDVQLKRKYDLIPAILTAVKAYAKHEKELFFDIARLRTEAMGAVTPLDKGRKDTALTQKLGGLVAVAEQYPKLRASENFLDLQRQLKESEDLIALSRRYYNGTVRNLNMLVARFPTLLLASIFGFSKREFFEIEQRDRLDPRGS